MDSKTFTFTYQDLKAEYRAAKSSRFRSRLTGVNSLGSGADYHYRSETDYYKLIELGRDFDRNDPIVGQGITRAVSNVVQDGFKVEPNTGDKELDDELAARFRAWASDKSACSADGCHNLNRLARLVLRHTIVDGDVSVLPLKSGHLEVVEGHRLKTPRNTTKNMVHGVLLDEATRRRKEYWFSKEEIDPCRIIQRVKDIKKYPAYDSSGNPNVFFIFNPKRASQTRGISALAPIADTIKMHDDIQFATLVKAQVASAFAIFRRMPEGEPGAAAASTGEEGTEYLADGSSRSTYGIQPGMEIEGRPGEEITGFSPNIPNPEFFPHATMVLGFVSVNLGIPLCVLLLDPSNTNFSGYRGALEEARRGFREQQALLRDDFYSPVYRWKLRQFINQDAALGRHFAKLDHRFFNHTWTPPYWSYIEPNKEAAADAKIIDNGLSSRRTLLANRGLDIEEIDRQRINDRKALIENAITAAEEINAAHEDAGITWREILEEKALTPTPTIEAPTDEA